VGAILRKRQILVAVMTPEPHLPGCSRARDFEVGRQWLLHGPAFLCKNRHKYQLVASYCSTAYTFSWRAREAPLVIDTGGLLG